jgi:hypothetical protein
MSHAQISVTKPKRIMKTRALWTKMAFFRWRFRNRKDKTRPGCLATVDGNPTVGFRLFVPGGDRISRPLLSEVGIITRPALTRLSAQSPGKRSTAV